MKPVVALRSHPLLVVLFCAAWASAGCIFNPDGVADSTGSDATVDRDADDVDGGEAVCQNGLLEAGELCDGSQLGGQDCQGLGFLSGTLSCTPTCEFDTSLCLGPGCGNGELDPGEECDGIELNGHDCTSEGFFDGTLGCDAFCNFVTSGCHNCGDGVRTPPDECEGADLGTATCVTEGYDGGDLSCNADCTFNHALCSRCPNGVRETGEECDSDDLGTATCQTEGFFDGTLGCNASCSFNYAGCHNCGDGTCQPSEHGQLCPADCAVVIWSDDFEGDWPGSWTTGDNDGNYGTDTWDRSTKDYHSSGHSVWCAEDGTVEQSYVGYMQSWADHPVDLSSAANQYVELEAWLWVDIDDQDDYFVFYYYDGADWVELPPRIRQTSGWQQVFYDISSEAGSSSFILSLYFYSDASDDSPMGAFVDDLVIRRIP